MYKDILILAYKSVNHALSRKSAGYWIVSHAVSDIIIL